MPKVDFHHVLMIIMSLDNFHNVQIILNLGLIICLFMQIWNWNFTHLKCSQRQLFGIKMFIGLWNLCFYQLISAYTGFKMLKLPINRKTLWNFRCFCNKMNCIIVKNQYFSVLKTGKCSHSIGESKYRICKSNRQRYHDFILISQTKQTQFWNISVNFPLLLFPIASGIVKFTSFSSAKTFQLVFKLSTSNSFLTSVFYTPF